MRSRLRAGTLSVCLQAPIYQMVRVCHPRESGDLVRPNAVLWEAPAFAGVTCRMGLFTPSSAGQRWGGTPSYGFRAIAGVPPANNPLAPPTKPRYIARVAWPRIRSGPLDVIRGPAQLGPSHRAAHAVRQANGRQKAWHSSRINLRRRASAGWY